MRPSMENALRRRLEILKERARRIASRRSYPGRGGASASGQGRRGSPVGPPGTLDELLGGECLAGPAGECYVVRREETASGSRPLGAGSLASIFGSAKVGGEGTLCFLDIETAGLAPNTYLFLCGVMVAGEGGRSLEQVFARDYSEEKALLHRAAEILSGVHYVVTYNGLAFDLPFMKIRMAVHRIPFEDRFTVLDLLYPARKEFSSLLSDCRLETVEAYLRGDARTGDIAGREIPDAYHEFVRTGDARLVAPVVEHNLRDLSAMELLLEHLAGARGGGGASGGGAP